MLARIGITASCSSVPAVRSRTRPMLVTIVPMKVRIRPMIAGIITQEVSRSGLKSTSALTWSPILLSTETVAWAANRLEPSTSTVTGVESATNATSTSRRWTMSCASAAVSAGSVVVTSKKPGSMPATWSACGPTTAVATESTEKFAA